MYKRGEEIFAHPLVKANEVEFSWSSLKSNHVEATIDSKAITMGLSPITWLL